MSGISSIVKGEKTGLGNLLFNGEHWINYLRPVGSREDSAMVSIYHGRWSPVGSGTVAYVRIAGSKGFAAACTYAPAFEQFIRAEMSHSSGDFADLSVVPADFRQEGNLQSEPSWTIRTQEREVRVIWEELETCYVGPQTNQPK